MHNKIGLFVFQKLEINQIQNWQLAAILNFGFLHIFSSLLRLCSDSFVDNNSTYRPFTTGRVYLPEKNRSDGLNKTMIQQTMHDLQSFTMSTLLTIEL